MGIEAAAEVKNKYLQKIGIEFHNLYICWCLSGALSGLSVVCRQVSKIGLCTATL